MQKSGLRFLLPESGRSPGVGNGNLPQYSCLENSMDRGAWWATVDGVTKSYTLLSMHTHFCQPFQGFFHNKVRDKLSIRLRAHEMQDPVTLSIVSSTLA